MRPSRKWLAQLFGRQVVIVVYHRVTELNSDPWSLAVTPRHFAEHLQVLRRRLEPIRLEQLVRALRGGDLPRRAAVITFDDGYADNLHQGKPLLDRYDVPATVFVATGALASQREFWWDELDRLLLQPGAVSPELCLNIAGRSYSWNLGEVASYAEAAARDHRSWRAWEAAPTQRHAVYQTLCQHLRTLPPDQQEQVVLQLLAWANATPTVRPSHRALTSNELVTLARGGLVEFGAHTVTHSNLALLSPAAQRWEIEQSKASLDAILDKPVTSFAYPFGSRDAYSEHTILAVKAAGFASACSTAGTAVGPSADAYQLPRIYAQDCDGDQFEKLLSRWTF